ncbi:TPA: hypothetical protein I0I20_RS09655 [Enterococcus faecium]|nr:hypothetical protein [Enterococcus faecium]EME3580367.1 hypothetical protein [Enterococcus faecium]EME7095353.1 hypothetical protein [Enterococcus faecium]
MNNLAQSLDSFLTDPDLGKYTKKESHALNLEPRKNVLTSEHLDNDQDDFGNFVYKDDQMNLIHLTKHTNHPEWVIVTRDGLLDALEEYEDYWIEILPAGKGKEFVREMESMFGE